MKILLTNDDGYDAPGILALYKTLASVHDVILIAPDREKSAVGHGITLHEPIRINPIPLKNGDTGYAITGTPVDCIKLGLFELCTTAPDLIVSGINPGSNTGININYSGTVGAAREGAINKIASMAVSILKKDNPMDFKGMAQLTARLAGKIHGFDLPFGTFLNINAPNLPIAQTRGMKITRQASHNLSTQFDRRTDPKNRAYYWYGQTDPHTEEADTDVDALSRGYISITPIQCDLTDYKTADRLKCIHIP